MESLNPTSKARIINSEGRDTDMRACKFASTAREGLYCIVDKDSYSRILYDDGEMTFFRFFLRAPFFPSEKAAQECIKMLGAYFFTIDGSERRVPEPEIITFAQAAVARLAMYEALTHERGE